MVRASPGRRAACILIAVRRFFLFLRCCIFCGVGYFIPDNPQKEADCEEEDPGHVEGGKGKHGHEVLQRRQSQSCGFQSIIERREEGEDRGQDEDPAASPEEALKEGKKNEGDRQGIEEKKHRNGPP